VLVLQPGINNAILALRLDYHRRRGRIGKPCAGGSAAAGWIHGIGAEAVPRRRSLTNSAPGVRSSLAAGRRAAVGVGAMAAVRHLTWSRDAGSLEEEISAAGTGTRLLGSSNRPPRESPRNAPCVLVLASLSQLGRGWAPVPTWLQKFSPPSRPLTLIRLPQPSTPVLP
jgi:hypothetical protein